VRASTFRKVAIRSNLRQSLPGFARSDEHCPRIVLALLYLKTSQQRARLSNSNLCRLTTRVERRIPDREDRTDPRPRPNIRDIGVYGVTRGALLLIVIL